MSAWSPVILPDAGMQLPLCDVETASLLLWFWESCRYDFLKMKVSESTPEKITEYREVSTLITMLGHALAWLSMLPGPS